MAVKDDGAIYGVTNLKHNGVKLGLISEDGLQPGGDAPTKTRIWAAQKRNAPFKVLKSSPGTKMWTLTLIELTGENMKQVMGGEVDSNGNYTPPSEDKEISGVFDIECTSGHTIRIYNGTLTCNFSNGINFTNVLGIECELEMQDAGEGKSPYKVFAPGQVPSEEELPSTGDA